MNSADSIIRIRNLRKVYKTGRVAVEALRGVDLDVPKGEFLSVVVRRAPANPRCSTS